MTRRANYGRVHGVVAADAAAVLVRCVAYETSLAQLVGLRQNCKSIAFVHRGGIIQVVLVITVVRQPLVSLIESFC